MLYLIGLGLGDLNDITIKGKEAISKCDKVIIECYTSVLINSSVKDLEKFYGKKIIEADREMIEQDHLCDSEILKPSKTKNVALLIVGDPFGATTHTDIMIRAFKMGIKVEVIHNASIMNAIGCCGLQLYKFGQTVSIVFFNDNWRPDSFYEKIKKNREQGLHTLCLLDIKVKEQSLKVEDLLGGKKVYLPPRFMTVNQCINQLIEVEEKRKEKVFDFDKTQCIGLARIGAKDQLVISGSMNELKKIDFGQPLHSFIITGEPMHFLEKERIQFFSHKNLKNVKYLKKNDEDSDEE